MLRYLSYLLLLLPVSSYAQNWKVFDDPNILFTAKYPANWTNSVDTSKVVFFNSPSEGQDDNFNENINVTIVTDPSFGTTLKIKDLIPDIMNQVKGMMDNFTEESRSEPKWNNVDAFEITYTANTKTENPVTVRMYQRVCFYKTRLYVVTYTALKSGDNFAATAKEIINSIRFKE